MLSEISRHFLKNFCPFAFRAEGAAGMGRIAALRAAIKSLPRREFILLRGRGPDFRQKRFGFCPKGPPSLAWLLGR
ncbi:hypothetical protein B6D52_00445 [Candidatus Parcubacteria bacterium 4484_255]|nr:MAG: hypothetical protein B6D52_00445 [Candidatus Parcubacteria bacterium 4484_255]